DRQPQSEHVVESALHPAHIFRAGRQGLGGIWLGHYTVTYDRRPGPPRRKTRETRRVSRRFLPCSRAEGWRRSRPFRHDPRRKAPRARPRLAAEFFFQLEAALLWCHRFIRSKRHGLEVKFPVHDTLSLLLRGSGKHAGT